MEIDFDFDGSLKLTDVVEDFYYSPTTGLYVFRHPLVVDKRVLAAADGLGLDLTASPEKWLVQIPLADALRLLDALGASALSLPEYFQVRKDALDEGDHDMLASLEPDQFIEMLATVFLLDKEMIHHPVPGEGKLSFSGEAIPVDTPEGRYGWILQEDIDLETGLPTKVKQLRDITDETIKYWDTHTDIGKRGALMAVRGFVTSVGKVSLDLGFPADAVSHKMTIRECRKTQPEGVLPEDVLDEAKKVFGPYYDALADKTLYEALPSWWTDLVEFVERHETLLHEADDTASQVLKDDILDALGVLRLVAERDGHGEAGGKIRDRGRSFAGLAGDESTDMAFLSFVRSTKERMNAAVDVHGSLVFVEGHANPDTDTVVSALAEAFRQHLLKGDESTFVPVVPGTVVPAEVIELAGPELSKLFVLSASDDYITASTSGRPEWIMVDHNVGPEQPDTRAIIDHHYPDPVCLRQQIPRRIIFAGSASGLVALRFYGMGLELPPAMARILHGATLMDTENRFPGKMTPLDVLVMDRLREAGGQSDETSFYRRLMRCLISTYDPVELFRRDYKEDWCFFGFAVAKAIRILDSGHTELVAKLQELARKNNAATNLPLTLVKIVDYGDDAETIRRERMYPVFAPGASKEFQDTVRQAIVTVIRLESPPGVEIDAQENFVEYWGTGTQLSRKKLAPVLDPVVTAFNRYFYSKSTGLHFKRDFLRNTPTLEAVAEKAGFTVHADEKGVVVGNPGQLKYFLQELGFLCASPAEYFKAWNDAGEAKDARMVKHLTSSKYLETLDAIIEDHQVLVEHPVLAPGTEGMTYDEGERRTVEVPKGEPGLIDPAKVHPDTGLPTVVEDPQQYGTGLWRYWSPDADRAWALRSTIFAYDIPSLDLKFAFDEALPRLSIRPVTRKVKPPKVSVRETGDTISIDVRE